MAFDWKKTLGAVAPLLGTALGGPLGALAGQVLGTALGVDGSDEEALAAALQKATPEQLLAIKTADNQFKLDMAKLGMRPEELEVEDRISARAAQAATKDGLLPWLAVLVVGTFCGVVAAVLFGGLKVEAVIGGTLIGYLSAKAEQVLSFYFGSTKSSRGKDQALADALAGKLKR
jgi:uncharacterized membrane protein YeaQ/YmgE (transglycosylase-associated protein family)